MLAVPHALACTGFHYVDAERTCSWYEHHYLGGCQRPLPRAQCTHANLRRTGATDRGQTRRLAVLIPFRGAVNADSFKALCRNLPGHLQQQGTNFHLLAVNQIDNNPFNRAALANAAFRVLMGGGRGAGLRPGDRQPFTCVAIHDVDRFPSTSNRSCASHTRTYYTCPTYAPVVLHPESYTGGVLLMRPALFRAVNGFSNEYWGWGHEDNDFYLRLRACGRSPVHGSQIDSCMEHRDCDRCKRAKPAYGLPALRSETKMIALLRSRIPNPLLHAVDDGVANVSFSAAERPVALPCGQHTLHVLDVQLHRKGAESEVARDSASVSTCLADGSARDDGCVARVDLKELSERVLARARRGLPPGARFRRVLGATRQRTMYNYNYEVDMEADTNKPQPVVVRVAICAQEWQDSGVPDTVRYQLLWRAVASMGHHAPRSSREHKSKPLRFRLAKNFTYKGHFPCALRPAPKE